MDIQNTQSQMRKGVLEFCILSIIQKGEVYPSDIVEQMKAANLHILEGTLYPLLTRLKKDYNIPTNNIIAHSDIAPSRKADPSAFFPWKNLAELGFGFWPEDQLEKAPDYFNVEQALRIIGYNTQNLSSAIKAFKLHYIQTEVDDTLDEKTIKTIYSIYKKQ